MYHHLHIYRIFNIYEVLRVRLKYKAIIFIANLKHNWSKRPAGRINLKDKVSFSKTIELRAQV